MNEFRGKVLKLSLAKPQKIPLQGAGNRAVWETEEWLQSFGKKLTNERRGVTNREDEEEEKEKEDEQNEGEAMEE